MSNAEIEQAILEHVRQPGYKPVKPRMILEALGWPQELARDLKNAVKHLVKQGKLAYGASHLVGLPNTAETNRVTGTFRRMEAGHGFVTPVGTTKSDGRSKDIFIPARHARDAASGDKVLVRLSGRKEDKRRANVEGEIVQVIERETHHFVGTYLESAGMAYVQVDGAPFTQPIFVGDPGAKDARPDDKVVIEMVRFPSHTHDGEGVITEVLGQRGAAGVDTLSIIREFNLPGPFAEDALEDARRQADLFDESIGDGRTDMTKTTVLTIDPVDARDFDDAISLEQLDNGHWLLGVHIADVSHFVRPKSALDREARDRATSVYLPDRVIPMIPEIISNNLASLQPNRVRYTKSATIEFTADGARVGTDYHSAAIESDRRFTYEEVDDFLAHRDKWKKTLTAQVHGLLSRMHELAMILRRRRMKRGSLELSMQEVKVDLDKDGRVCGAHLVENTESHQIIEEFMLAANEAVATLLAHKAILFLRRVHEAPDPRKLDALTEFVTELGFKTENLQSRFEIQKLLEHVRGRPEEHAVNYAVLRSLQQAIYSPAEEGHYALASDCYCHFTSPIRRYPDLTVHRLIDGLLTHKKPRNDLSELVALGDHCSERERRAEAAERELIKVKLLDYMSHRIGEEMDAVVTGVREFGMFAQGIELPADGFVHVSSLQDDYYRYDGTTHSLTGNRQGNCYRLGDLLRVAVARVDVDRRQLDFRVVSRIRRHGEAERPHAVRTAGKPSGHAAASGKTSGGKPPGTRFGHPAKEKKTARDRGKGGKGGKKAGRRKRG